MAEQITIDVDDKGNIGTLPEPLQKFLDTRIGDAVRRKAEALEKEYKPRLRSEADEEKLKTLESENSRFKEEEAKRKGEHEEAKKIANERHAAELKDRDAKLTIASEQLARRDGRLRTMLGSEIKAAAVAAGARAESIPELVKLLGADLDLDAETLEGFVKGADGKPLEKDGKRVSIDAHVAQYLVDHPHHLASARGKGGNAPGGHSMRGGSAAATDKESAIAAATEKPNLQNVAAAVGAVLRPAK